MVYGGWGAGSLYFGHVERPASVRGLFAAATLVALVMLALLPTTQAASRTPFATSKSSGRGVSSPSATQRERPTTTASTTASSLPPGCLGYDPRRRQRCRHVPTCFPAPVFDKRLMVRGSW